MIICSANELSKMYGGNLIFEKLSLEIHEGDNIGLIGQNGSGKTTIFKLLAAIDTPDHGEVHLKKDAVIGYLAQIPHYSSEVSVKEVLEHSFKEVFAIEAKLQQITERMADPANADKLESLYNKFSLLQEEFDQKEGYQVQSKLGKVINGLGLVHLVDQSFKSLSGGEKTKVGLATILLQEPDLLLLDEPTNHLDLEAIEWLEEFLRKYTGSVVVISHDRYFLDKAITKTFDLEDGELTVYHGNYSAFMKEKEERLLAEFQAYQDQQKKIKKMKETIKRLKQWANEANPPNDGLHRRAKSMEKALERIGKLKRPVLERRKVALSFDMNERSGKDVLVFEKVAKGFDCRKLFHNVDLFVRFREKIAIVGNNGTGKTTLFKLLSNELSLDEGEFHIGSGVKIGYLSQQGLDDYNDETVIEAFRDLVHVPEGEARQRLAQFLFYGASVFRKVKDLSGGERMRLRFAQMMYQNYNLLLLDEPTNHLDIESREMLEDALEDYDGTIVAISHDRYFLNKLFDRIAWLESQTLTTYIGNYDDAKEERQKRTTLNQ
jgi:ATP-binding cassette subfamily F protein 3